MTEKTTRIYELGKEYKISSNALIKILKDMGYEAKSHMSVASPEMVDAIQRKFAEEKKEAKKEMEHRAQVKQAVEKKEAEKKAAEKRAAQELAAKKVADKRAAEQLASGSKKPAPQPQAAKPAASGRTQGARIGGIKVADKTSKVAQVMRKVEKKQKRKDRRKQKGGRVVDQADVAKSFKTTMANLSGVKTKRKYRREGADGDKADQGPANVIAVSEYMSIAELAKLMDLKPAEAIAKLFELGMMATINQRLDMDTITMLAAEFDFDVTEVAEIGESAKEAEVEENLTPRAPVVTVMGHVDHGKTSLLDFIRDSNIAAGEAGSITQHIGAYRVKRGDGFVTFVDTPGHEAFTAMRARGSQITDIVVLIVAADDGVQPQTVEAIDHARAAGAPIIVAINKIDKPQANIDNVRTQLSSHKLLSEEWGGNTIVAEISAKTGEGVDKLLELILLQAEMMDLKADASIRANGVVVDSRLERGRGPVITVLIQKGTCKIGDPAVCGTFSGRIRTLSDDRGNKLEEVGPATPVQVTGLGGVPQAGDTFMVVESSQVAKEIASGRAQIKREHDSRRPAGHITLDKVFDRIKEGEIKDVRLIIKADVDGSIEVLSDTLGKIATDEVKTNIIHTGVGAITESDVLLAAASNAIILGFQVRPEARARDVAKTENVDIRLYDIIYEVESDVKKALEGLLSPEISEKFAGLAEVRDTFRVPKIGVIAGSYIKQGLFARKNRVRLIRDGKVIFEGEVKSLKRFKDDAREVKEGFECGIGLENYDDIKVGDQIESYEIVETARTLE